MDSSEDNYVLIPESKCEDQDEWLNDAEIARDIAGWQQEIQRWEDGEIALRTTLYTDEGQRIAPEMMTKAQFEARTHDMGAGSEVMPEADPYRLIGELLQWAGRDAATSEQALEVHRLRQRAHAVLQAANAK